MKGGDVLSPRRENKDLPKHQLLGRERQLNKWIGKQKDGIEECLKEIQKRKDKISEHKVELKEIQKLIKEEQFISDGKRIYIIRGNTYTKGKVSYRGKYRWFHLGRTDTLREVGDDELKETIRERFSTVLITK